jgi:protein arginine kinase
MRALGLDEATLASAITETANTIVAAEQMARQALLEKGRNRCEDRVHRAWGLLTSARVLSNEELTEQMSWVRLGVALHLLREPQWATLDRILVQCQPAHLQVSHANANDTAARDELRASLVRRWLVN